MKKRPFLAFVLFVSLVMTLLVTGCHKAQLDADSCYIDFDQASKAAASKKKDILILVTIENADPFNEWFVKNIIHAPASAFASDFLKNYIVFRMDLSQGINNYSGLLNISMTPSVFLLSKEGFYLTHFIVTEESDDYDAFKKHINQLETSPSVSQTKELIDACKKGSTTEKLTAINNLYDSTPAEYRAFLSPLLQKALKYDKANKTGLRGKMIYAYVDAAAVKAMSRGDIQETIRLYRSLEKETLVDEDLRQQALYTADYLQRLTDARETLTHTEQN